MSTPSFDLPRRIAGLESSSITKPGIESPSCDTNSDGTHAARCAVRRVCTGRPSAQRPTRSAAWFCWRWRMPSPAWGTGLVELAQAPELGKTHDDLLTPFDRAAADACMAAARSKGDRRMCRLGGTGAVAGGKSG